MVSLTLTVDEAAFVHRVLTAYLSDLRSEIHRTDSRALRQALKRDAMTLISIAQRLEAPHQALPAAASAGGVAAVLG